MEILGIICVLGCLMASVYAKKAGKAHDAAVAEAEANGLEPPKGSEALRTSTMLMFLFAVMGMCAFGYYAYTLSK